MSLLFASKRIYTAHRGPVGLKTLHIGQTEVRRSIEPSTRPKLSYREWRSRGLLSQNSTAWRRKSSRLHDNS